MVAMEAMLLGKPVVGSATGGLAEIVQDGVSGLLVPAENPQALADAIARLMQDSALSHRLSAASRDHIMRICGAEAVLPLWRVVFTRNDH